MADAALDALGAQRDLVLALSFAPFLRAIGIADRHADDRDGRVDAADRRHARNAPSRADDDLAADLLAEDPVRRADVAGAFGRDGRRLQAEPGLAHRRCGLVDDSVLRRATAFEREVEARKLELDPDHVRDEHTQGFFEQLLPGLVPLEHDDRPSLHGGGLYAVDRP